jgi:hypothetical protein
MSVIYAVCVRDHKTNQNQKQQKYTKSPINYSSKINQLLKTPRIHNTGICSNTEIKIGMVYVRLYEI